MPPLAPAQLLLPRLSLSACVRGLMLRNTLGCGLSDAQRYSHYPATPLCSLSFWFSGRGELLAPGAPAEAASPRQRMPGPVVFAGPTTQPSITWTPGPAHGLMLLLMPDAVQALTGLEPVQWLNRMAPAHQVLPADWAPWLQAVLHAPDDAQRLRVIEDFLHPRWQALRPDAHTTGHALKDWVQGLGLRALTSRQGRSLRQMERRIKHWTGQPLRELHVLARAEQAFFELLAADPGPGIRWAEIALDSGYADQAHLCRVAKRVTGFSPETLRQRMAHDESLWVYRLWV